MLNKSTNLSAELSVAKLKKNIHHNKFGHTGLHLKSDLDVQQTEAGVLKKTSSLGATLGAAKFIIIIDITFATLYLMNVVMLFQLNTILLNVSFLSAIPPSEPLF